MVFCYGVVLCLTCLIKYWMPRIGKEKKENGKDLYRAILPFQTQALGPSL